MTNSAVSLEDFAKCYGQYIAVNKLSLKAPSGSIYGFIGENGSGKTTTIRMILHIIFPDSGSVEVFGRQETRAAIQEEILILASPSAEAGYLATPLAYKEGANEHDLSALDYESEPTIVTAAIELINHPTLF